MTPRAFYRAVMEDAAETRLETAKRAAAAVLQALRDRLTPEEADQVAAQLPAELKTVWYQGEVADRRPARLRREAFYERVRREARLGSRQQARAFTLAVFGALKRQLSPGEAEDVLAQLPKDLKEVWEEARAPNAGRGASTPVREIMTRRPVSIDPDAPVATAVAVMRERRIRHLPVVDDAGRMVGIVSDRDLRTALLAPALAEHLSAAARRRLRSVEASLENLPVRRVMTWRPVTVEPDAPVGHAAALMLERGLSCLPVVEDGRIVGIVTERDVLRRLAAALPSVKSLEW